MKAMVLEKIKGPLVLKDVAPPTAGEEDMLLNVEACAVCRTDLHIIDGEVEADLPLILGHQIVGKTKDNKRFGAAWLGWTCGTCDFCRSGRENLCDHGKFNGKDLQGGFAQQVVVKKDFVFELPLDQPPELLAPLLCAGMIGYRAYKMAASFQKIGFYGFGAAAHLLLPLALHQRKQVYVFTKPGDANGQKKALEKGAAWAGDSTQLPPEKLDGAIIFAPVGALVPPALKALEKGGALISAGIHMSDIPSFPYNDIWEERMFKSVANLTRQDGEEYLEMALSIPIVPEVQTYRLDQANQALDDLRNGSIEGSAVILL